MEIQVTEQKPTEKIYDVHMRLTAKEALAIQSVVGNIKGPVEGPRGVCDVLYFALHNNITQRCDINAVSDVQEFVLTWEDLEAALDNPDV